MTALLVLLLGAVEVERVDLPMGGFVRPGEWSVAVVHLRSDEAFEGFVEIQGESAMRFRARASLPAGGAAAIEVPFVAVGPKRPVVAVRSGGREVARRDLPDDWRVIGPRDLLVGFAAEAKDLPRVEPLGDGASAFLFQLPAEWKPDSWLLEPVDVIVGGPEGGRGAWKAVGGERREDAKDLGKFATRRAARIALVDGDAFGLAPADSWPQGRRNFVLFFSVVYAFAAFVLLLRLGRRGGFRALAVSAVALSAVFAALAILVSPAGRVSAAVHRFDFRNADGTGGAAQVIFVTAHAGGPVELKFDRRVRPLFRDERGAATTPLAIETTPEGASIVTGWEPGEGDRLAFVSLSDAPPPEVKLEAGAGGPPFDVRVTSASALRAAAVMVRGLNSDLGPVDAGGTRSVKVEEDGPPPPGAAFAFLRPHLFDTENGSLLFARLKPSGPFEGVASADLLESRQVGHFLVARWK